MVASRIALVVAGDVGIPTYRSTILARPMAYIATEVPGAAVAMVSVFGQAGVGVAVGLGGGAGVGDGAGAGLAHPKAQTNIDETSMINTNRTNFFTPPSFFRNAFDHLLFF